ncbi:MAG TPA: hypothetical protein VNM50_02145 [Chloroflexota bacterium]|nr:hypothetical protein [Chloroflexota bacterium]
MAAQPPEPLAPDPPDTIEILAEAFQRWKATHPEGSWREFWTAVGSGEVPLPA